MSWQRSLQAAIRALKKEEEALKQDLVSVREKIAELTESAKSGGPRPASARRRAPDKNRLSPAGKAAISRAAKKRWADYRKGQKKR